MSKLIKSSKMRRSGLMCNYGASTAVCMSTTRDPRSVVVLPMMRHDKKSVFLDDDDTNTRLINNTKYSKLLVESRTSSRFNSNSKSKCVSVSVAKNKEIRSRDGKDNQPKELHQKTTTDNVFQVVVMRVAIDCQGCAGKVKRHLSKMEGVTSFRIDVESKRVTVMGHISPVVVLESISKVKRAEFWNC